MDGAEGRHPARILVLASPSALAAALNPIRRMIDEHCYGVVILSSLPFTYIRRKLERHLQQNGERPLPMRV